MAVITFPTSPIVGQIFSKWIWDGAQWADISPNGFGPWTEVIVTGIYALSGKVHYRLRGVDMVDLRYSFSFSGGMYDVPGSGVACTLPVGYRPAVDHIYITHFAPPQAGLALAQRTLPTTGVLMTDLTGRDSSSACFTSFVRAV